MCYWSDSLFLADVFPDGYAYQHQTDRRSIDSFSGQRQIAGPSAAGSHSYTFAIRRSNKGSTHP